MLKDVFKCRGCRLNKCLSVGMEARMVRLNGAVIPEEYLDNVEKHKKSLLCQQNENKDQKPLIGRTDQNHQHPKEAEYDQPYSSCFVPNEELVQNAGSNTTMISCAMNQQATDSGNWHFEGKIVGPEQFGLANWPLEKRSLISSCQTAKTLTTVREMVLKQARFEESFKKKRVLPDEILMRFDIPRELLESSFIFNDVRKYPVAPRSRREQILPNIINMNLVFIADK
ncbi:hypothetical protein niasHT_034883 [Heterodera trifolii]|uniref:Nuclear receptor domain-containing protein n=1 Tax=Heterodera trifolii TaxID=157864 RepID=A0ABD2IAR3_9BILA